MPPALHTKIVGALPLYKKAACVNDRCTYKTKADTHKIVGVCFHFICTAHKVPASFVVLQKTTLGCAGEKLWLYQFQPQRKVLLPKGGWQNLRF